jgi:hypothetical protein
MRILKNIIYTSRKTIKSHLKKIKNLNKNQHKSIRNLGFRTRTGSIRGKTKARNQDDFFIIQEYGEFKNQTLT